MKKILLTLTIMSVIQSMNAMDFNQPIVLPVEEQAQTWPQGYMGYLGSYLPTWAGIKKTMPYWPAAITAIPPAAFGAAVALDVANIPMSESLDNALMNLAIMPAEFYRWQLDRLLGKRFMNSNAGSLADIATYFGMPVALALAGCFYNRYQNQHAKKQQEEDFARFAIPTEGQGTHFNKEHGFHGIFGGKSAQ